MHALIMSILAIGLLASVTLMTLNYLPVDALQASKSRARAQQGFDALSAGSIRYIKSLTDPNGMVSLPAGGVEISGAIQPAFGFIPPAPNGMQWSVFSAHYSGLPAIAICLHPLSGNVEPAVLRGALSVKAEYPSAAVFVSDSCLSSPNPNGKSLTYWVVANHVIS